MNFISLIVFSKYYKSTLQIRTMRGPPVLTYIYFGLFVCERHWYWGVFCFFPVILNAVFCYFSQLHLLWQNNELCCLANRNKKPWNVCYLSTWYQFIHCQFGQFRQYTVEDNKVELFWKCRNYIFISKLLSLWLMIASISNQSKDIPT